MRELSSQQAEQQYIDSMLGLTAEAVEDAPVPCAENVAAVVVVEPSEERAAMQQEKPADDAIPEAASANHETGNEEKANEETDDVSLDNLYQLIAVAGLKLAVPVTAIHRVEPGSLSCVDGGRLRTMDGDYTVVDIARFIDASQSTDPVEHYLLIAQHNYAIACGELLSMETIEPATVCKRSAASNRIWLAGTIGARQIAVLDLDGIAALLQ